MRIDDENKVVVPEFVAEWIEYNLCKDVPLSIMLSCYKSFLESDQEIKTDGARAVEWFVKYPYEFVRAYVEGYTVKIEEPSKKYYWRKKKEYLAWFEDDTQVHFVRFKFSGSDKYYYCLGDIDLAVKLTEQQARDLLKDDFDKFEKVECE